MSSGEPLTVLHYLGYDNDRGGIVSVVRTLASANAFACVLGVNPGFVQHRAPPMATLALPAIAGETISSRTWWRARAVARAARDWLREDPRRVFHGHSRAGLLVAMRLARLGETRVVASVHCYGRQRWFYRHAARVLGARLFWLSPAMRRYYGVAGEGWAQCIPGAVAGAATPGDGDAAGDGRGGARGVAGADEGAKNGVGGRGGDGVLRLGGVGTLIAWKGWHLVVDAIAALPADVRTRIRFTHIGGTDGSAESRRYAEGLRGRARAAGVEARVTWRGEQPSSAALLRASDALVVASTNEPFSVAMLEALRAGVPVVAADSGGAVDLINPPVNGWLFRSGDVADLARVLRERVEGGGGDARIDAEGLRRFSAEAIAGRWRGIYGGLV